MLVVKIELHSAITRRVTEIGRMYIHNVGGSARRGNYEALVCRKGEFDAVAAIRDGKALRKGAVTNYPRLSYNVWRLVLRSLRACFPEERQGGLFATLTDDQREAAIANSEVDV